MKKRGFVIGFIILLVVASGAIYAKFASQALAANQGDQDGTDLHILVEASADNGATWHNFTGTEFPGGETLNINPGATIIVRAKVWNDGDAPAANVQIIGEFDNAEYLDNGVVTTNDLDIDGRAFVGFTLANGGQGTVNWVAIGGNPDDAFQGLQGTMTFGNNFPNGQTIINGGVLIHDYGLVAGRNNPFFRLAHAEGVNNFSQVRLVVNRFHASTGVKLTPAPTSSASAIAALPSTGGSMLEDLLEFIKNLK